MKTPAAQGVQASIRQQMNNLTAAERQVAEYVTVHKASIMELSMLDIAREVGVSDATVLRFVRDIGYDGFNAFKIALAAELMNPSEVIFESVKPEDSRLSIIQKVLQNNIQLLQDTIQVLDPDELDVAVETIIGARRIYICAAGTSGPMALWLYDRLSRLGFPAVTVLDPFQQLTQASIAEPADLFIVVSRSGEPATLVEVMKLICERDIGIHTIVITCDKKSSIAKLSKTCLVGISREIRSDVSGSSVSISSVIDVLYTCLELVDMNKTVAYQRNAWRSIDLLRVKKRRGGDAGENLLGEEEIIDTKKKTSREDI